MKSVCQRVFKKSRSFIESVTTTSNKRQKCEHNSLSMAPAAQPPTPEPPAHRKTRLGTKSISFNEYCHVLSYDPYMSVEEWKDFLNLHFSTNLDGMMFFLGTVPVCIRIHYYAASFIVNDAELEYVLLQEFCRLSDNEIHVHDWKVQNAKERCFMLNMNGKISFATARNKWKDIRCITTNMDQERKRKVVLESKKQSSSLFMSQRTMLLQSKNKTT